VVSLHEQRKDMREGLRCDANAVVPHPQDNLVLVSHSGDPDVSIRVGVLGGIGEQIAHDLRKPHGVSFHEQPLLRKREIQMMSLGRDKRLYDFHRPSDDGGQFHGFFAQIDLGAHYP
jgi:hypothetical protein